MGRPTSRLRTLVGPSLTVAESPLKASIVSTAWSMPRPTSGEAALDPQTVPVSEVDGPAPVMLSADTELSVLMQALLGTSGSADAAHGRAAADVESRLAEVLADVGLAHSEASEAAEPVPVPPAPAAPVRLRKPEQPRSFTAIRPALMEDLALAHLLMLSPPRPRTRRGRWLWVVVPALLAVLIAGMLLAETQGEGRRLTPSAALRDRLLRAR